MSLTLLQPLSAVSHGSSTVCFLPLLNQMGCVCFKAQSQRNTERQGIKGHPLSASRAVCPPFPHSVASWMCHSIIFFLTLMIKPLLPQLEGEKCRALSSVTLHSRIALWAFQGINYCTALLWQGWFLLSLSPLLLFFFLFHFPAPLTFLFLLPAQPTQTICPSPNASYPSLKERPLSNLWSLEIFKILTLTFEDLIAPYLTVLGQLDRSAFSLVFGWDEERLRNYSS